MSGDRPPIYCGVFRGVAVTADRKIVTDLRDLAAYIGDEGDVRLIGQYQAGFVEVCLAWHQLEDLYKQAQKRRNKPTP